MRPVGEPDPWESLGEMAARFMLSSHQRAFNTHRTIRLIHRSSMYPHNCTATLNINALFRFAIYAVNTSMYYRRPMQFFEHEAYINTVPALFTVAAA